MNVSQTLLQLASTNKCQRCYEVFLVMIFQFVYKLWIIFLRYYAVGKVQYEFSFAQGPCLYVVSLPDKTSIQKADPENLEIGGWQTSKL